MGKPTERALIMTLSTAHVPRELMDAWTNDPEHKSGEDGVYVEPLTYGFLLILTDEADPDAMGSKPLSELVGYALRHWCGFVRLDRDGPVEDDLSTYPEPTAPPC